jgi:hypothetical protein
MLIFHKSNDLENCIKAVLCLVYIQGGRGLKLRLAQVRKDQSRTLLLSLEPL